MNPAILMISHVIPYPPAAGNEIRIFKMIQRLKKEGYRIVFLLNAGDVEPAARLRLARVVDRLYLVGDDFGTGLQPLPPGKKFRNLLKKKAADLMAASFFCRFFGEHEIQKKIRSDAIKKSFAHERLVRATALLCQKYDPCAVIAEYIFTAPCLDVVPPGVLKIIDTHDMFSRKSEQVVSFGIDDPFTCTRREERRYLLKCDLVIAIQSNEARMFRDLVPEREVVTVGIDFDDFAGNDGEGAIPGRILVVGSDNPLNIHGLEEFLKHAWPAVRAGDPGAVLRVIGKIGEHLATQDERIHVAGWVEDLDEEYRKAAVVINPTMAGTGLKIKSVEALCRAKPLIGCPNSFDGLDFTGDPPFVVCGGWREFSEKILALLQSEENRRVYQVRALRFVRENFSGEKVYYPLIHHLDTFCTARYSPANGIEIR